MTDFKFNPNHDADDGRFASGGGSGGGDKPKPFNNDSLVAMQAAIRAGDAAQLRKLRADLMADTNPQITERLRNGWQHQIDVALAKIARGKAEPPPGAHKVYGGR
jgi:hypothetical protein